jgi:cobalamin biosynthesis Mg chelatase CobN
MTLERMQEIIAATLGGHPREAEELARKCVERVAEECDSENESLLHMLNEIPRIFR